MIECMQRMPKQLFTGLQLEDNIRAMAVWFFLISCDFIYRGNRSQHFVSQFLNNRLSITLPKYIREGACNVFPAIFYKVEREGPRLTLCIRQWC